MLCVRRGGGIRDAGLPRSPPRRPTESARGTVLAAVEVLGSKGLHRIGEPAAVLVALFGVRATKRVGAAALDGLALDQLSPLRLAVAASDLLGPEQLESILALRAPPGTEPVPKGDPVLLGQQLASILGPYTAKRRVELLRSLWDDVVGWQLSAIARGRARRRPMAPTAIERWQRKVRRLDSAWWQAQAAAAYGDEPDALALAIWVPSRDVWQGALERALHECGAATTLLRTALAAEERPVQAAVLAHLEALDHLARRDDLGATCERAALLAATVALASDTAPSGGDRLGGRDVDPLLATQLRDAWALAHATLAAALGLGLALQRSPGAGGGTAADQPGRGRMAGGGRVRAGPAAGGVAFPPAGADHGRVPCRPLLSTGEPSRAASMILDDGLWIADLADALAAWYGHVRAEVDYGVHGIDVDPADDEDDPRSPRIESVPLAIAGAAQLLAVGTVPPARPKTWEALVAALVAAAENLGLDEPFPVAAEVAATDRTVLPDTDLVVDVARTPRQLAEWGNYMGNCIAGYADDANRRFALVALRGATGTLAVNIALQRGTRRWFVSEAFARFNEDLPAEFHAQLDAWAEQIPVASPAAGGRGAARPRRTAPGGRRPPPATACSGPRPGWATRSATSGRRPTRSPPWPRPWPRSPGSWGGPATAPTATGWTRSSPLPAPGDRGPSSPPSAAPSDPGAPWPSCGRRRPPAPLAAAIERAGDVDIDLRRLTGTTVPSALRLGLRDSRVRAGRTVDLAGRRLRMALAELLVAADPRLDRAVIERTHVGFVTAAVLVLTARDGQVVQPVEWVPVAGDGSLPGRPRSSVRDERGPWAEAQGTPARWV